jgi:hypothetical protein
MTVPLIKIASHGKANPSSGISKRSPGTKSTESI